MTLKLKGMYGKLTGSSISSIGGVGWGLREAKEKIFVGLRKHDSLNCIIQQVLGSNNKNDT